MTTIRKIKSILLGTALLTALSSPFSLAALRAEGRSTSGPTELSASVPEFIILHYYSSIAMNFDTPDTEAIGEGSNSMNVTWQGVASGGEKLDESNFMDAKLMNDSGKTTVKLQKVWAVRGFSTNGTANVSISLPAGTAMKLDGSVIGMSNAKVSDGTSSESGIITALNGITKKQATIGDVLMDLDFTATTVAGNHIGGKYIITASTK